MLIVTAVLGSVIANNPSQHLEGVLPLVESGAVVAGGRFSFLVLVLVLVPVFVPGVELWVVWFADTSRRNAQFSPG